MPLLRKKTKRGDFCEQDLTGPTKNPITYLLNKLKRRKKEPPKKQEKPSLTPPIKKETTFNAYCVKCRKKVDAKDPEDYTMKNKRQALKGTCPHCSTKVFRILGMKKCPLLHN